MSDALTQASYYVEALKYSVGEGAVERVGHEHLVGQFEVLLRDVGVDACTGAELVEGMQHYAKTWTRVTRIPQGLTYSMFSDGVLHGIALAGGLSGQDPPERSGGADDA